MSKINNIDWIICFGYDITSTSVVSTKHLIDKFIKEGKKVLWINPVPFRNISFSRVGKTTFFRKIIKKIKTHLFILRFSRKGMIIYSPIYLPEVEKDNIEKFNNKFIALQIYLLKKIFRIKKYFIWTTSSFTVNSIINNNDYEFLIYQVPDLISDFRGISENLRNKLKSKEKYICDKADLIFTASRRIYYKIIDFVENKEKVIYLPHGVDYDHFSNCKCLSINKKLINSPIAGYFGSLTNANDQDIFIELAKNGFTVILIGKILGDYSACEKYNNIIFLGPIPYKDLPKYANCFDVCLLNWKMAEWIKNSYPKKTLEYLAMGKPIVSVRIPELENNFDDLIYFADTPEEFVSMAKKAISEDNEILRKRRKMRVKSETWDNRFKVIKKFIEKL